MKTRTILLGAFLAVLGTSQCSRRNELNILSLPDWSTDLGHQMGSVEMTRLGPDSLAILWRTRIEVTNPTPRSQFVDRTCIAFGRPQAGTWSKPLTLMDEGGSGSYMIRAGDSLHVFVGMPLRHFVFESTDAFAEVEDPRFEPHAHWPSDHSRREIWLRDGSQFIASLESEGVSILNMLRSPPARQLHVRRIEKGRDRPTKVDVSKVKARRGELHGLALAEGDGFAYVLVADNPNAVRFERGIRPRHLRTVRLLLATVR